jgi:hypothetical protein
MKKVLCCIISLVFVFFTACTTKEGQKVRLAGPKENTRIVATLANLEIVRMEDTNYNAVIIRTLEFKPIIVSGVFAQNVAKVKDKFSAGKRVEISFRQYDLYLPERDDLSVIVNFYILNSLSIVGEENSFIGFYNYRPPYYFD